jgi:hypothetical protein
MYWGYYSIFLGKMQMLFGRIGERFGKGVDKTVYVWYK